MARLGAFDATLDPKAWFDAKVLREGWFADELIPTPASGAVTVQHLIVAGGGGGGGCGGYETAGGGGAGGLLTGTMSIAATGSYTITVGAGGAGGSPTVQGSNGGNSSITGTGAPSAAIGGGAGGSQNAYGDGLAGGSGGGAGAAADWGAGTSGQGNNGGSVSSYGGGGGGAGEAGNTDGDAQGGDGVSSSISGSAVTYAGGGAGNTGFVGIPPVAGGAGGGGDSQTGTGQAGSANTGGGGGAGDAYTGGTGANGGAGGSGVVILRYATADMTATGGTITTVGSDTVHTFNSSGTFTVTAIGGAGVTGTGAAVAPALSLASPTASAAGALASGLSGVSFTATKVGVDEAPQSVQFSATVTGIANQSDAIIFWDFGDTYQFRYLPSDTKANDRQSGTAIGHRAAHVYRAAGTYTVTCTAYEFTSSGVVSVSTTQNVVIAATDAAITTRVAISKSGSFTGAPAGATQVNWSGGEPSSLTFNPNTAYYFEAGQTFDVGLNAVNFAGTPGVLKLHRYGAGADPVFSRSLTIWGGDQGNTTIAEIEFLGTFDVDDNPNWDDTGVYPTPPPAPPETGIFLWPEDDGGQTMLVYGVKVSGYQISFYSLNRSSASTTHFVDCESTNWFNYGVLSGNIGAEAWVGSHIHQKIGTQPLPATVGNRQWNSPDGPNTARQGAMRIASANPVIINKCNAFSYRSGWSGTIVTDVAAIQSAIRLGTSATSAPERTTLSQCDLVGGAGVFVPSVQNAGEVQSAINYFIFENNYLSQDIDGATSEFIATTKPGAHIRGNIVEYVSGIPVADTVGSTIRLINVNGALSFGLDATSFVYGNTLVVNGNTPGIDWQAATQIGAGTRPITYQNNVIQMNGTFNSGGSSSLFQTNYNPLQSAFPFAPLVGSAAYQTYSTGRLPALTQSGTPRVTPFSIGASEEGSAPSTVIGTGAAVAPALTLDAPVASASGAYAVDAVTGTGAAVAPALTLDAPTAAASGEFVVSGVTGTGAAVAPNLTLDAPTASASGTFGAAVTGTADAVAPALTLDAPLASAAGAYSVDPVTGTGAAVAPNLTIDSPTAAASGEYVISGVTGTGSAVAPNLTLDAPVASASGDYVPAGVTGTAEATAPALTLSATADGAAAHIAPVTGTAVAVAPALTLDAPVASASGEFVVSGVTGTGAAVAPGLTLVAPVAAGDGSTAAQPVEGSGAAVAPALTLVATASALGSYSDFVVFAPSLTFTVELEQTVFTVEPEQTVFIVIQEAA